MYGKHVKVVLPYSGTAISVFIFCTPSTPDDVLQEMALKRIIEECQIELSERNFANPTITERNP